MNNNGFTLIEVICAFSVLMIAAVFLSPLLIEMRLEQKALSEKRNTILTLQNKLHEYTSDPSSAGGNQTENSIEFIFTPHSNYIEGCALWERVDEEKEKECLYAPLQ
ncbi:type II secretion system protein [Halobacillus sp. A5]|uniref:type II secretion system protein n=1 Tax=Halobacillus sp. A5 TaxID=2880263 RepID=UPI0020A6C7FE|nr:type II secretion system protein [Halobacillus sp. A5]MCP3025696.1 type II secretion system GspH family protein [Halobacillus sp. A5]